MRLSMICTVLLVLTAVAISGTEAGRRNKKLKKRKVCKYNVKKPVQIGDCDDATQTMQVTYSLKRGPDTCATTDVRTLPCDAEVNLKKNKRKGRKGKKLRCKYSRKGVRSGCDPATGMKTVTRTLKDGQPTDCPPTKIKQKKCGRNGGKAKKGQ